MKRSFLILFGALLLTLPSHAGQITASRAALATVDHRATAAGLSILRSGGNAADAAVAVSFALAVVHPQAGNLGGGGFLLYYEKSTGAIWTLDFREVAPAAATSNMFVNADGTVKDSLTGAMAAGVPGSVAGMSAAHKRFGKLPWKTLLEPSIALATEGYDFTPLQQQLLAEEEEQRKISRFPKTAALFFPEGKPLTKGARVVQKELGVTLQRIADRGASEFYEGQTAKKLVTSLKSNGGIITLRDLRDYKVVWRAPVAVDFGPFRLYTMPPPSGGAVVLGQSLGMLKSFDLATSGFQSAKSVHLIAEASRRSFFDRNEFIGDPSFVKIPLSDFFSEKRLETLGKSIDPEQATPTITLNRSSNGSNEPEQTTHYSIVDAEGNIASVTTTLNGNFGSGLFVDGGYLVSNTMDDFAIKPGTPNLFGLIQSAANQIRPGARPSSSMTPLIVMRNDRPWMVLGSPGGATIPTTLLQVFVAVSVQGKSLLEAIEAPRYHQQDLPDLIHYERTRFDPKLIAQLEAMGHACKERSDIGDVHAVMLEGGKLIAVSDSRRGGSPGGY